MIWALILAIMGLRAGFKVADVAERSQVSLESVRRMGGVMPAASNAPLPDGGPSLLASWGARRPQANMPWRLSLSRNVTRDSPRRRAASDLVRAVTTAKTDRDAAGEPREGAKTDRDAAGEPAHGPTRRAARLGGGLA